MPPSTALAPTQILDPETVQMVLLSGDLARLTFEQRTNYYRSVCESVGLNPLTQPFEYLKLQGKEKLYARKDATDQLRFIHRVSIDPRGFTRELIDGVYVVTATAALPSGRMDVSTGAVPIEGLRGEAKANAMMKAETKAKRRVTLSICGLGMLDETEIDSIPGAQRVPIEIAAAPIVTETAPPDFLTSELPESSATAPAKRGVAPSAPTSAPSAPDSGNAPVTKTPIPVVVLDAKVGNRTPPHYYEIFVRETDAQPFEPAREHVLITKDEAIYKAALDGHGTGLIFDATWHDAKRTDGKRFLALDALEVVQ